MENKTRWILIIVSIVIVLLLIANHKSWSLDYREKMKENKISEEYIKETSIFNYKSDSILSINTTLYDEHSLINSIKNIGDYVYYNVNYLDTEETCEGISASDIIERRKGLCSTQAKLDVALLRSMGIASRPVLGCRKLTSTCSKTFAVFQDRPPKVRPIKEKDGFVLSRGGLHTWVEVWLPYKGWVILEPTNGLIYDIDCQDYKTYLINPNDFNICGLYSSDPFIKECGDFQ